MISRCDSFFFSGETELQMPSMSLILNSESGVIHTTATEDSLATVFIVIGTTDIHKVSRRVIDQRPYHDLIMWQHRQ